MFVSVEWEDEDGWIGEEMELDASSTQTNPTYLAEEVGAQGIGIRSLFFLHNALLDGESVDDRLHKMNGSVGGWVGEWRKCRKESENVRGSVGWMGKEGP